MSQCYSKNKNIIHTNNHQPCGSTNSTSPHVPCCASGDQCMSGGLCHYTYSINGGSGYYAAGCTDSTYSDSTCPDLCTNLVLRDVTWLAKPRHWACCGQDGITGHPKCNNATKQTFADPQPASLKAYYVAGVGAPNGTDAPSSSVGAAPGGATANANASANASASTNSTGLSGGAAAGIGAGVAVGVLALVCGVIACLLVRRRRRRKMGGMQVLREVDGSMSTTPIGYVPQELSTEAMSELDTKRYMESAALEQPPVLSAIELPGNEAVLTPPERGPDHMRWEEYAFPIMDVQTGGDSIQHTPVGTVSSGLYSPPTPTEERMIAQERLKPD
ncbi:hypothetical protein BT63DRAFT_411408 [Microthyrium microscopicum]|uniref:Uncharacterized protein n=1 Tax=Microthyrium microscopicum TaxID=703497 RepID=A0A6A6UKP8_9PEZI|nr:hypothetical protein BT63DRAFT_411408 [Microthyrium microscopicum]